MTTLVTLYQFKMALASQGQMVTVQDAVPADVSNPIRIQWDAGPTVTLGDTLSNFVQTTLSYSAVQMQNLFDLAATFSPTLTVVTGTLGAMKSRIADEIARADLTSQIANAINDAIEEYKTKRWYWDDQVFTFQTVNAQAQYTSTALAQIPYLYDVDDLFVIIGNNNYRVKRIDPSLWDILSLPSVKGQPYRYRYYQRSIWLYPVPDQAFTMKLLAASPTAAPASEVELNNPWMNEAERLIRISAKRRLNFDVIKDYQEADACATAEKNALDNLRADTSSMIRLGAIEPMAF